MFRLSAIVLSVGLLATVASAQYQEGRGFLGGSANLTTYYTEGTGDYWLFEIAPTFGYNVSTPFSLAVTPTYAFAESNQFYAFGLGLTARYNHALGERFGLYASGTPALVHQSYDPGFLAARNVALVYSAAVDAGAYYFMTPNFSLEMRFARAECLHRMRIKGDGAGDLNACNIGIQAQNLALSMLYHFGK